MKIAVIGPQNSGKTTFIKDFLLAFPEYKTPKESYRDIIKKHKLPINQKTTEHSQKIIRDFIHQQVKNCTEKKIIFDRSLICNYVYTISRSENTKISDSFIKETKNLIYDYLNEINYLIFIPSALSINLVNDNLRDTDKYFIDKINSLFIEILLEISEKTPNKIIIISGTREERIIQIKKKLDIK